jgi:SAM-dependent methyltransferase
MTSLDTSATRVSPRWEDPRAVAGFVNGAPNEQLLAFAQRFIGHATRPRCLDLGCGAARNSLPLARLGFRVTGTDLSEPMLAAARDRAAREATHHDEASPDTTLDLEFLAAPMAPLPFPDDTFDLIVAHGIWNLAHSGAAFRAAVAEAARVAKPGAGLFVFTFSRHTLPDDATPDAGESFVFSSWNGEPQVFLRQQELIDELARAGFVQGAADRLVEYNRRAPDALHLGGPPVIYEATFTKHPIHSIHTESP